MNFLQYARYINSPYIMVRKFATKNRSTKNTGENFNFPRHKDYFTDDYWNQNGSEEEEEEPKMTRSETVILYIYTLLTKSYIYIYKIYPCIFNLFLNALSNI